MSNYLSLNRFFTKTTFNQIISNECCPLYTSIKKQYSNGNATLNKDVIASFYSCLEKNYRNEYFYKNTLFYELILAKHKIESTKVYSELSIGKCIADLVTINGKAIVYEIKTEFDNLDRIEQQFNQYYECFPYVVIVCCSKLLPKVTLMYSNSPVGIYCITNNNKIKVLKEPEEYNDLLDKKTIFDILRKKEYESVLRKNKLKLPHTTQVKYHSECLKLFTSLDISAIQKDVLFILKKRFPKVNKLFYNVPNELKMLVYQSNYNNADYSRLFTFLESQPINYKEEKRNVFSILAR